MGGIGSGRHWYSDAKDTVNDYQIIDVRRWQRDGFLAPHKSFAWGWNRDGQTVAWIDVRTEPGRVILSYRHRFRGGDWKDATYPVSLEWTPCNFGGQRAWFRCPAMGCGRRVALLYGGGIFACRKCHQLAYPSQRESYDDRAARRADTIRDRLGWQPGILNGAGRKPKGMHWGTFERLTAQHDTFVQRSLAGFAARLRLIGESLDDWI